MCYLHLHFLEYMIEPFSYRARVVPIRKIKHVSFYSMYHFRMEFYPVAQNQNQFRMCPVRIILIVTWGIKN